MAQTISTITGVAISPLLGMGAVGAWQYFKWQQAPESSRGQLPWYANPLFWIPALLVVGLVGLAALVAQNIVVEIRPGTREVVVGPREALRSDRVEVGDLRWLGPTPTEGARVGVQL